MDKIDFYCRKCRKSFKMSYEISGNDDASAMNGIMIRCHTNKSTRVVILKNFTEGQIISRTESYGKCYL